jgi:hypothetical protein
MIAWIAPTTTNSITVNPLLSFFIPYTRICIPCLNEFQNIKCSDSNRSDDRIYYSERLVIDTLFPNRYYHFRKGDYPTENISHI